MDNYIDTKTALSTAKLVASASSFLLGGYCLSFSQSSFPPLYDQRPQASVHVFRSSWTSAEPIVPPLSILSTCASAYLAYALPEQRREWTTAAVTMASTILWTGLVMKPGINRLQAIGENKEITAKSEQTLEHRQLLIKWVKQNYVVVVLQLMSGFVALRASVQS